jgi:hypothetical protein
MDPVALSCLGSRRPRSRQRRCLLKGCGQCFRPSHPQHRYCSGPCREAARRWRYWQAQQKYRASSKGRSQRQQQARRYRQRCREQPRPAGPSSPPTRSGAAAVGDGHGASGEGKRPARKSEKVVLWPCARPGCYVLLAVAGAYSSRRFCCDLCRKALRCVLQREARWQRRRQRGLQRAGRRPRRRARGP